MAHCDHDYSWYNDDELFDPASPCAGGANTTNCTGAFDDHYPHYPYDDHYPHYPEDDHYPYYSHCDGLSKKKCGKEDGCVYKNKMCMEEPPMPVKESKKESKKKASKKESKKESKKKESKKESKKEKSKKKDKSKKKSKKKKSKKKN